MVQQEENNKSVDVRRWAAAERQAQKAEEVLRTALKAHMECGEPAPTSEMQRSATELRAHADAMFKRLDKQMNYKGLA